MFKIIDWGIKLLNTIFCIVLLILNFLKIDNDIRNTVSITVLCLLVVFTIVWVVFYFYNKKKTNIIQN